MAPARAWEEYLFSDHKAVAVSPWRGTRGLQLLDVLVKRDTGLWGDSPVLRKVGTFFGLCGLREGEDDDKIEVIDEFKEALLKFKNRDADDELSDDEEEPIIECEDLCDLKETFKTGSKILASIMKFASLHHNSSQEFTLKIEDVKLHSVDKEHLTEAIREAWRPNMESFAIHGASPSKLSGVLDLWLITDILYADKFTVEANMSRSDGAGVQVPGLLVSAAVGVSAPSAGLNLANERSAEAVRELSSGSIPFAIRAMRLRYKSNGKLHRIDTEGGSKQPTVRAGSTISDELVDPVRDPAYNMGDLFLNAPTVNSEEDSLVTPLRIVVDDAAESAQECD